MFRTWMRAVILALLVTGSALLGVSVAHADDAGDAYGGYGEWPTEKR